MANAYLNKRDKIKYDNSFQPDFKEDLLDTVSSNISDIVEDHAEEVAASVKNVLIRCGEETVTTDGNLHTLDVTYPEPFPAGTQPVLVASSRRLTADGTEFNLKIGIRRIGTNSFTLSYQGPAGLTYYIDWIAVLN